MAKKKNDFMGEGPRQKKIIIMKTKNRDALMKEMKIGKSMFYNAMKFASDSELAQLVRHKALSEYGGILTKKMVL